MNRYSRFGGKVGSWSTLVAALGVIIVSTMGLAACTDLTTSESEAVASTGGSLPTTTNATTAPDSVTTTSVPVPTTTSSALSEESLAYARSLGGTSHMGEKLYFVIGASVKTEAQAKALLEPAKAVGDMQSSFIVQLSDNFDGMRAGYWVVFEAYGGYPSVEDLQFCRRPFPNAYVKRATVMTEDPIPVRPGG